MDAVCPQMDIRPSTWPMCSTRIASMDSPALVDFACLLTACCTSASRPAEAQLDCSCSNASDASAWGSFEFSSSSLCCDSIHAACSRTRVSSCDRQGLSATSLTNDLLQDKSSIV